WRGGIRHRPHRGLARARARGVRARHPDPPARRLYRARGGISVVWTSSMREEMRVIEIAPIETPSLGDRSYLATDGSVAIVIDPQRDIDRVLPVADSRGVRVCHVFETHIHNDYVTGGLALARA